MITDLLKAGFPCVLLQTLEPHRTEDELRKIQDLQIAKWDCIQGIRGLSPQNSQNEGIQNSVEAVTWLMSVKDPFSSVTH